MSASPAPTSITFTCKVTPNARRSECTGWSSDEKGRPLLLIKLNAPPVEGKANAELLRFLAETLDCAKGRVVLVRGESSRLKVVEIPSDCAARLPKRT
jgi:hypothetical protein